MSDEEEDTSSMMEQIGVIYRFITDEKSMKESNKATKNMTGLIDQLAVAGKVAGSVLGKMWAGVQKAVKIGLDEHKDIETAMTLNVNPEDMNFFAHVMSQIGGSRKDALGVLRTLDDLIFKFKNPEFDEGATIGKIVSLLGKSGVPEESKNKVQAAIDEGSEIDLAKAFGDLVYILGEDASNVLGEFGLDALKKIETPQNMLDWTKSFKRRGDDLYDVNVEGLDSLSDGFGEIKVALGLISQMISGDLGPIIEKFGAASLLFVATLQDLRQRILDSKWFKDNKGKIDEIFNFDTPLDEGIMAWMAGVNKNLLSALALLPRGEELLDKIGLNYEDTMKGLNKPLGEDDTLRSVMKEFIGRGDEKITNNKDFQKFLDALKNTELGPPPTGVKAVPVAKNTEGITSDGEKSVTPKVFQVPKDGEIRSFSKQMSDASGAAVAGIEAAVEFFSGLYATTDLQDSKLDDITKSSIVENIVTRNSNTSEGTNQSKGKIDYSDKIKDKTLMFTGAVSINANNPEELYEAASQYSNKALGDSIDAGTGNQIK